MDVPADPLDAQLESEHGILEVKSRAEVVGIWTMGVSYLAGRLLF